MSNTDCSRDCVSQCTLGRRVAMNLFLSVIHSKAEILHTFHKMSPYAGMSKVELKAECRRYGLSTYGKMMDLETNLLKALVKRTNDTIRQYPAALTRPSYLSNTVPELRAEARARKLHVSGTKDAVVKRLRDADWKEWNCRLQLFPQFAKLPVEIQEYIWEYSLPGPRILAAALKRPGGLNGLYFPKVDHTPNPTALSACHLSRTIALKRYRLVFGTKNTYADLEGGDIFYIGPHSRSFCINSERFWECEDENNPPIAVISDLERVTHILLSLSVYGSYTHAYQVERYSQYREDPQLKRDLLMFKSLKKVSLVCGGYDDCRDDRPQGQVYIEHDIMRFLPLDAGNYWSYHPMAVAVATKSHFYETATEEEIVRGIPTIDLVEAHRIPDPRLIKFRDAKSELPTQLYVSPSIHRGLEHIVTNFCSMVIWLKIIGKADGSELDW